MIECLGGIFCYFARVRLIEVHATEQTARQKTCEKAGRGLADQPCLPHDASYFRRFYHGQMGKALEVIQELPSTTSRPSAKRPKRHTATTAPAPPWSVSYRPAGRNSSPVERFGPPDAFMSLG